MSQSFQEEITPLTTKGDIAVFSTIPTKLGVGGNGTILSAASGEATGLKWINGDFSVVKTIDETINDSAVFQNDNELVFTLVANTSYVFELLLLLNAVSVTPDFKFQWTVPAGATMFWGPPVVVRPGGANPTVWASYWGSVPSGMVPNALLTEASTIVEEGINGTRGVVYSGIVRCAGTAGSLQLQWAQNTQTAEDSKVLKDSYLKIRKLQ